MRPWVSGKEGGMKRRDFIVKSGMLLGGAGMACCGLLGCGKKEEKMTEETAPPPEPAMSRLDMIKKQMMEKMGLSEAEVATRMKEFEDHLSASREQCLCPGCPSYVEGETKVVFCNALVGKSDKITERRGCLCGQCPVYKSGGLKHGYYCVQGSELELNLSEM
jgi:hypothetical protein